MQTYYFGTADASVKALYSDYINVSEIDQLANDFLSFSQGRVGRPCFQKQPMLIKGLKTRVFRI